MRLSRPDDEPLPNDEILNPGDHVGEGLDLQGQPLTLVPVNLFTPRNFDGFPHEQPADEFQVVRRLGTGSYAVVYLVREVLSRPDLDECIGGLMDFDQSECVYGKEYALKCLSRLDLDEQALQAQMAEATIHQSLPTHPNIVTLHRTYETPSFLLLLLEYVPGEDLFYFLEQDRDHYEPEPVPDPSTSSTPPTPSLLSTLHPSHLLSHTRLKLIASMFAQMCDAVAACHDADVFHRDIKPENFIVTDGWCDSPSGLQERKVVVKLTDFGLSTMDQDCADMDCGSAPYMSFECRNNCAPTYSPRAADVWSLGIVLINMLYHVNPWTDTTQDVCSSFSFFRQEPATFWSQRFAGMTYPVAKFFTERVFCILDDPQDWRGKRVSAREFGLWVRDLPAVFGACSSGPSRPVTPLIVAERPILSIATSSLPMSQSMLPPPSPLSPPPIFTPLASPSRYNSPLPAPKPMLPNGHPAAHAMVTGHKRVVSASSIGYSLSLIPQSRRPSSRQASFSEAGGIISAPGSNVGTPLLRSRALPLPSSLPISRAPSYNELQVGREGRGGNDLPTVFDNDLEEEPEREQEDDADDDDGELVFNSTMTSSRSTSVTRRRKRGARKGKGQQAQQSAVYTSPLLSPGLPLLPQPLPNIPQPDPMVTFALASASQNLVRELSRTSRSSQSGSLNGSVNFTLPGTNSAARRPIIGPSSTSLPLSDIPPSDPAKAPITVQVPNVVKKTSKWKLSFGKSSGEKAVVGLGAPTVNAFHANLAAKGGAGREWERDVPHANDGSNFHSKSIPMSGNAIGLGWSLSNGLHSSGPGNTSAIASTVTDLVLGLGAPGPTSQLSNRMNGQLSQQQQQVLYSTPVPSAFNSLGNKAMRASDVFNALPSVLNGADSKSIRSIKSTKSGYSSNASQVSLAASASASTSTPTPIVLNGSQSTPNFGNSQEQWTRGRKGRPGAGWGFADQFGVLNTSTTNLATGLNGGDSTVTDKADKRSSTISTMSGMSNFSSMSGASYGPSIAPSSNYPPSTNSSSSTSWRSTGSSGRFTRFSNGSQRSLNTVNTLATSVSGGSGSLNWRNNNASTGSLGSAAGVKPSSASVNNGHGPVPNAAIPIPNPYPTNVKFMTGVPWALDELPRSMHPNPTGDIFGGPPQRKQRNRKPKELPTINERPGGFKPPKSPLWQRQDASSSVYDLKSIHSGHGGSSTTSLAGEDVGSNGHADSTESSGPRKVQKGQITALAKMLSALRR